MSDREYYEYRWRTGGYGGPSPSERGLEAEETLANIIVKTVKFASNIESLILEVGCGDGKLLKRLDDQTVGVDFSKTALTIAKKCKGNVSPDIVLADAYALPFLPETFDLILSKELLEHLEKPERFLGETRLLLKRGATAIVVVPNVCNLRRRTQMLLGWGFFDLKEHLWHFTVNSLKELLKKMDFTIVNIKGDQVMVPLLWRITPKSLRIIMARLRASFAQHIIVTCKKP